MVDLVFTLTLLIQAHETVLADAKHIRAQSDTVGGGIQMMIDFASLKIGEVDTDSTDGSHLVDLVFTLLVLIQAPEGLLADA